MYFRYFEVISPLEKDGPFIWKNLSSIQSMMHLPSFVEIAPVVPKKNIFF